MEDVLTKKLPATAIPTKAGISLSIKESVAKEIPAFVGMAAHKMPLGEILQRRGLLNDTQLARALTLQERSGSRLGDTLIGEGLIGYLPLYRTLAEHYALPFIDLLKEPPDPALLQTRDIEDYLRLRVIPWSSHNGQMHIAVCDMSDDVSEWIAQRYGTQAQLVITSPLDIRRTVERHFGAAMEKSSRLSLWRLRPQASARITMTAHQTQVFYGLIIMITAVIATMPVVSALALIILCHVAFALTMLFKCWIFAMGTRPLPRVDWKQRLATLNERKLPIYTILIPMYKEAESLPGMLDSMRRLDYPAAKLDIKLVLEADDRETLQAAYALKPKYQFEIICVPPSVPRTKPKACNYALRFARGEFITIFDADDRPERQQIKKAVYAFRHLPPEVVCLQARLNYYNANDNLLTRFFSLEYTILFHFMLYGLERLGIPIPLGGTSNHIALKRLRALGEWDPYNVTEDADLGTRLASRGLRTAMLDSFTMEESPNTLMPWIRQRSRWIKGYMQTWLVHMRDPAKLYRTLGLRSFIGFQFFIGFSSFTFLTAPLVWALSLLWIGGIAQLHHVPFPVWLGWLTMVNLLLNLFTHWYCALYCAMLYRKYLLPMLSAAFLYPLYLLLHSVASYKALWQLIVKPHFWEKTVHGLARKIDLFTLENDLLKKR